jgi:hypothetical protein
VIAEEHGFCHQSYMLESYFGRAGNDVISGLGFRVQTAGAMTACMELPLFATTVHTRWLAMATIETGGVVDISVLKDLTMKMCVLTRKC